MEELERALGELVSDPPSSAFSPETVVVSSKGMERWLSLRLSDRFGVWSNSHFPFPRAFVESVLDAGLGIENQTARGFDRDTLVWALHDAFDRLSAGRELDPVRAYLENDERGRKQIELAERLAHVFDQYPVYRPEMVLEWERGAGSGFQPVLWRAVIERLGSVHVAARARDFRTAWQNRSGPLPEPIPPRVSVFGVSTLPPIYVEILALLSERIDVHLFLLGSVSGVDPAEPRSELDALGKLERDFARVLAERAPSKVENRSEPVAFEGCTLLDALRAELLGLERVTPASNDRSISVHSCHGPMRQVEVLREQLLAAFEADPTLEPRDVVIMTPDVEAIAPFVHAVFGVDPDAPGFIPYRISDLPYRAVSPAAEALLALLRVLGGRLSASDVLDLLQQDPIRARAGIDESELGRIERWIVDAKIRWALDAEHRSECGQPPFSENTWRFGLDRLLIGFALPEESELYSEVLPLDVVEGRPALALGALAELVERLASWKSVLAAPRSLVDWRQALFSMLAELVTPSERDAWGLLVVREAIDSIVESASRASFTSAIERDVMLRVLEQRLETERTSHEYLSGGVTVCALLPMRSIPFRLVCLLGMNDGEFPRIQRAPAFDEIARAPRLGDRNARDEDRYSFLEALLSTRGRLIITYTGRGPEDDSQRPPSTVVAELIDAIERLAPRPVRTEPPRGTQLSLFDTQKRTPPERSSMGKDVLVQHALQAFSPRYFGADPDPRLFSHSDLDLRAARALVGEDTEAQVAFVEPLSAPDSDVIALDDLVAFFEHPARHLLERRLGVLLRDRASGALDREPVELDALERYELGTFVTERALAGHDSDQILEFARAAGLLPLGAPGRFVFADVAGDAFRLARSLQRFQRDEKLEPIDCDVEFGATRVRGRLLDVWPAAQLRHTFARSKAKSEIAVWIRHLALQLAGADSHPRKSLFVSRARSGAGVEVRRFDALDREVARERLSELVEVYRLGQRVPLPLFPKASLELVETLMRLGTHDDARVRAMAAAEKAFDPKTSRDHSEREDPYVERLFGSLNPLTMPVSTIGELRIPSFFELSVRVFAPLADQVRIEVAK